MQNKAIKDIDTDKIPNVESKLRPMLKEFLEEYGDRSENYNGNKAAQEKIERLAETIQTNGVNISSKNKSEDEYFSKNPYVVGYFNNITKEVVLKDGEDYEQTKSVLFHEMTHYVNGFDENAREECVEHTWINEALTEESSANLAGITPSSYDNYRTVLDNFILTTYGVKNHDKYKSKISDAHLYGTKDDINEYIPKTSQYNLQGMFTQLSDIDINADREIIDESRKLVLKNMALESGKTILKKESNDTKEFLGIYNYKERYSKYVNSLIPLSNNITLSEIERMTRKQILRDFTDKAMKGKNADTEKLISSLLKNIAKDKIYMQDFSTTEGKTDILMEIARIKSYSDISASDEAYAYSMNDIVNSLEVEDSKIEVSSEGESIKFDTMLKPKASATMHCFEGEEYTYGTTLLEQNFKMESVTIASDGYITKTLGKDHSCMKEESVDTAYGRRMFAKRISSEIKKISDLKEEVMLRKKQATAEIDTSLNEYFVKYIGKDINEVYSKKNKKERTTHFNYKNTLPEGKIEKNKAEQLTGMDSKMIEENPERFANLMVSNFTQIENHKIDDDNRTEELYIDEITEKLAQTQITNKPTKDKTEDEFTI